MKNLVEIAVDSNHSPRTLRVITDLLTVAEQQNVRSMFSRATITLHLQKAVPQSTDTLTVKGIP
jgi:hypothetical protein